MIRIVHTFTSIQGEGIRQGYPTIFLRLFGCNAHCGFTKDKQGNLVRDESLWLCDSLESWKEGKENTIPLRSVIQLSDIITDLGDNKNDIVFTGGEPLLHINKQFITLLDHLHYMLGYQNIYFETNGSIDPRVFKHALTYVMFNCSPKTANTGNTIQNYDALKQITKVNGSCFKFVVTSLKDEEEIKVLQAHAEIPDHMIFLMPEGMDRESLHKHLPICAKLAIKNGWAVSNRMQVQIWNKTMGV